MSDASSLQITPKLQIPLAEIELSAIRAQGAGGQHLHKTASAVHLRFDVAASSLPEDCKLRLLAQRDQRLTADGVIVIKAQTLRSLEGNRSAALERLREMIAAAAITPRRRKATKPSRAAKQRRLDSKTRRGQVKALRRGPEH